MFFIETKGFLNETLISLILHEELGGSSVVGLMSYLGVVMFSQEINYSPVAPSFPMIFYRILIETFVFL